MPKGLINAMVQVRAVFYAILLGLFASLVWAYVWTNAGKLSPFWQIALALIGVILAIGAVLIALNYVSEVLDAHDYRRRRNMAITPEIEELRVLSHLNSQQLEVWFKRQVALVAVPGVAAAELYYLVDNDHIPAEFVHKWLDHCDEAQLAPKRLFSDHEYAWADKMTQFYVNRGLAHPHVKGSGRAATWKTGINLEMALAWFHLSQA